MPKKRHPITAYGKEDDQKKLEAVAGLEGVSSSQWVLNRIREAYYRVYGERPVN